MFGLTLEKLVIVAIIAAMIIGPIRLPGAAKRLSEFVRSFRRALDDTCSRVAADAGVADLRTELDELDLRQYDPRRIIREALETPAAGDKTTASVTSAEAVPASAPVNEDAGVVFDARATRPPGRWVVSGTSAHPRRVWVVDEPDPSASESAAEVSESHASEAVPASST
ncbi:Sec-independent protein translocase family protein [Gulosibacter faecalis]|jgi:sec-independent protein translocase protein TatB|uniref:Sec-independent protein translocase TatB n=1 Tax=Gulosibacter faecalis TaxID=272240 RepID=A0ABW5V191_9MICO|nr:hypothetical protein [Gulosibacter faecalis]